MSKMLLGETQEDLAIAINEFFSLDQYTMQVENNGLRVLECLRNEQYDVVILEIVLPEIDGINIVREYRAGGGSAPVVLMAGKHSSIELNSALDAGADAYLVKPFRLDDLAAMLRALLRRPALRAKRVLKLGNIALDTETGVVTRNDFPVHLFPMELRLLQFLMSHPNQVFTSAEITEEVWHKKDFGIKEDTVRTHIRTLRKKIDSEGCKSIIINVRGFGYKASAPDAIYRSEALTAESRPADKQSRSLTSSVVMNQYGMLPDSDIECASVTW